MVADFPVAEWRRWWLYWWIHAGRAASRADSAFLGLALAVHSVPTMLLVHTTSLEGLRGGYRNNRRGLTSALSVTHARTKGVPLGLILALALLWRAPWSTSAHGEHRVER